MPGIVAIFLHPIVGIIERHDEIERKTVGIQTIVLFLEQQFVDKPHTGTQIIGVTRIRAGIAVETSLEIALRPARHTRQIKLAVEESKPDVEDKPKALQIVVIEKERKWVKFHIKRIYRKRLRCISNGFEFRIPLSLFGRRFEAANGRRDIKAKEEYGASRTAGNFAKSFGFFDFGDEIDVISVRFFERNELEGGLTAGISHRPLFACTGHALDLDFQGRRSDFDAVAKHRGPRRGRANRHHDVLVINHRNDLRHHLRHPTRHGLGIRTPHLSFLFQFALELRKRLARVRIDHINHDRRFLVHNPNHRIVFRMTVDFCNVLPGTPVPITKPSVPRSGHHLLFRKHNVPRFAQCLTQFLRHHELRVILFHIGHVNQTTRHLFLGHHKARNQTQKKQESDLNQQCSKTHKSSNWKAKKPANYPTMTPKGQLNVL